MSTTNSFYEKFRDFMKNKSNIQETTIFIHASDIHLGSHQYRNGYRADDFIRAFQEILELSILHNADFILLGGDVFTSLEMLPGKLSEIIKILIEFKDYTNGSIPIIAIEGNHDIRKFSRGIKFPKRGQSWLKVLSILGLLILLDGNMEASPNLIYLPYNFVSKKGGKIQIKNVVIYGNHYLGENPKDYIPKIAQAIEKRKNLFCILLQHFGIEGQMENVPGIKYKNLLPLKQKVDYLALGHYHLQFIIDSWIYNPGSSEAVCSIDSKFKRGIFIVKVKRGENFVKQVCSNKLTNRNHIWKTIYLPHIFKNKKDLMGFIIKKLNSGMTNLKKEMTRSDPRVPHLNLVLKGMKPSRNCKLSERNLKIEILNSLPLVDLKIYQKFSNPVKTLNKFLHIQ